MPSSNGDRETISNQFNAQFYCFVISLKRTPERLQAFREQNANCEINFHHFEAFDGTQLTHSDINRLLAPKAIPYKRSLFGNALSHLTLWQRCAEQHKNYVVFEDDAVVRHDAKVRLLSLLGQFEGWDIVLLGSNTDVPLELSIAPGIIYGGGFSAPYPTAKQLSDFAGSTNPVGLHRLNLAMGTCGYVVSPRGSRVLMQACFPLDNREVRYDSLKYSFRSGSLDAVMAATYPKLSAYACMAPLVMTANNKAASTTNE